MSEKATIEFVVNGPPKNPFEYYRPFPDQCNRMGDIRAAADFFWKVIQKRTPGSSEQTLARRALEEAVMRANQSIVLNEETMTLDGDIRLSANSVPPKD